MPLDMPLDMCLDMYLHMRLRRSLGAFDRPCATAKSIGATNPAGSRGCLHADDAGSPQ